MRRYAAVVWVELWKGIDGEGSVDWLDGAFLLPRIRFPGIPRIPHGLVLVLADPGW